jgi:TMEM199 family protein
MVLLTTTPHILSAISSLSPSSLSSLHNSNHSLPPSPGAPIEHSTLLALSRLLKDSSSSYTLNTLLRSAHPYIPPPAPKPRKSPEYVALMARLRAEQEQREYRVLVSKNIALPQSDDVKDEEEKDDISPSLVFNILLSIIMCGAASFYMTRYWSNDGVRVLLSFLVAIVVGIAEVTVYAGYLRKVRVSRDKERKLRERKVVIESEKVGGMSEKLLEEKEEIWGRGVNGGMRRRVREKWEKEKEDGQEYKIL